MAALCLCQVWVCYLVSGTPSLAFAQPVSSARLFAALLADTVLLTGLFVGMWRLTWRIRRSRVWRRVGNVVFLLFLAVPANAVWSVFRRVTGRLNVLYWQEINMPGVSLAMRVLVTLAWVLLIAAVLYFERPLAHIAYRLLSLLFPLVLYMVGEASWLVTHPPQELAQGRVRRAGAAGAPTPARRVVWVIFDEMDYRLAFESPTSSRLPEFNRLAHEGLDAMRAYPPGGRTLISVPALLAGRLVTASRATGVSDLRIRYEGSADAVRWSTGQTIFDLQRQKGWRAGIAGWYFPYARIFGGEVEAWQDQGWLLGLNPTRPFPVVMADEFRMLGEGKTQALFGKPRNVVEHQRLVGEVVAEATRRAADPALDLVFLHLPVPHFPFYYDAETGKDAEPLRPVMGYLDHLQLGDHVLGEIRRAMQAAGLGDRTVLLVSSDHWNREADRIDGRMDHRVPFLLSFPGDSGGVRYAAPFNTVLSRRLVTAIMNGEIGTAAEAAAWLDRSKGGLTESPYNAN